VPVYNGARYIREALDSLLNQTEPALEILVMDDASTDETPEIVASYGSRVRYCRQPVNRGIYDNVNTGIGMACGDLIATYHADDVYEPNIVERQVDCFVKYPQLGAVFCLDVFVDADGREYGRLQLPPEVRGSQPLDGRVVLNAMLSYQNVMLVCPTAMVPARVHRALGVYRQDVWRNTSDVDMWLRIIGAHPILILEQYLMRYRHFQGQSSRRYHHLRREPGRFFAIMDHYLAGELGAWAAPSALEAYEAHRAQDLLMVSVNHYITGDPASAGLTLKRVRAGQVLGSDKIQRVRMLTLYVLLHIALLLPRSSLLAALFYWRWQSGRNYGGRGGFNELGRTLHAWWNGETWQSQAR
jgi:glycosyltransferase involved in cell wall biosynthesis